MVKETKLYDLLNVKPDADDNDLKKGYRKAALKYHPDKPTGNEEKFKDIGEAYEILSDKNKRAIYDQYGLDAVRSGQVPMPDGGGFDGGGFPGGGFPGGGAGGFPGGGQSFFSTSGPGGSTKFSFGGGGNPFSTADAFNLFNAFGGMGGGMGGHAMDDDDDISHMFGGGARRKQQRREPVPPKEIQFPVALRDLYTGGVKKLKVSRRGISGTQESNIVEMNIKPGWKAGTRLTFKGKGDYQPDGSAQDIVIVLQEKPDPDFTREGDDLKTKIKVSFKEALTGFNRVITTLDGKRLKISQGRPVQPSQAFTFPERGMPISKRPGSFGDLKVEVQIDFPTELTAEQRAAIERLF